MSVVSKLAKKLDINDFQVMTRLAEAPRKYKVYSIPKRTSGYRVIAHPSKELKELQRAFIELYSFPIHSNAMAYKKGISIKTNAQIHSSQSYLLKMDLSNFFNSITPKLLWSVWEKNLSLPDPSDMKWLENLLFWASNKKSNTKLVLSVGAPSSPVISNFCMFEFDELLTAICLDKNICYTRYADDMTFSTNQKNILFSMPNIVKDNLRNIFSTELSINYSKTFFSSKAHNRHVTGVTITNEGTLSLGREKKRYIKHLIHQFKLNQIKKDDIDSLKGWLSFATHIEPAFLCSLKQKYSETLINTIVGKNEKSK